MTVREKAVQLWQFPLLRGVFSFSAMRYGTKFLVLLRLIIIARFLGPRELGLFGLATMAVALTEVFTQTGINLVLLKNPEKLGKYLDTAWGISVIRGIVISLLILAISPWMTSFYQDAALPEYLLLAALIPCIRGFINPAVITYQQKLQFGKESLFRTVLQLIDILSGLGLVLLTGSGLGLVAGIVLSSLAELTLSFWLFPQRPNILRTNFGLVKKLYGETKYIIGHGILNYFTENADDFLIGKLLGTAGLGIYQTAYKWASAATIDVGYILGQIAYPVYARAAQKKESLFALWKNSSLSMLALFFLAGVMFLLYTEPFVRLALGENWLPAIPAIRLLFLSGVVKAFINAWNPLAVLADKLQHFIVVNFVIVAVMLPAIYLLAPQYGAAGASWGVVLAHLVVLPYSFWITWISLKKLEGKKAA